MNKSEFLNILRQSLGGEVAPAVLEQNISYYDSYISSQAKTEEEATAELGDPRLIAKTIIETDKIARGKSQSSWTQDNYYQYQAEEDSFQENPENIKKNFTFINMKWQHKLVAIFGGIALLFLIAIIGRFVLGFLFAFGLPIILILLVMALFRRR
jgi:uncharacterized membrane protein